jgi:hypothetical protein
MRRRLRDRNGQNEEEREEMEGLAYEVADA